MEDKRGSDMSGVMSKVKSAYLRGRARVEAITHGHPGRGLKVLAVLGTNGKTTTAQYINEMLQEAGKKTALLATKNEQEVDTARLQDFLQQAKKNGAQYAIVTLTAAHIRQYSLASTPIELAVVTNVSDTSDESADAQLRDIKEFLSRQPRYVVLNRDDPHFESVATSKAAAQKITYGEHAEAEAKITQATYYRKGSECKLVVDHQTELDVATYLVGSANVHNLVAAVTALYVMGEPITTMADGAARLEHVTGNYQYLDVKTPYDVVVDWAPNETALQEVVAAAKQVAKRRLIVALQNEHISDETLKAVVKQAARLIVVAPGGQAHDNPTIEQVDSPDAAIQRAMRSARQGDTVLLAGATFVRPSENATSYAQTTVTNLMQD